MFFFFVIPTQKWVGCIIPFCILNVPIFFLLAPMWHSQATRKNHSPPNLWTLQPASPSAASSSCVSKLIKLHGQKLGEKLLIFFLAQVNKWIYYGMLGMVGSGDFEEFTWKTNGSNMCKVRLKGFNSWRHRNGCTVECCGNVWKVVKKTNQQHLNLNTYKLTKHHLFRLLKMTPSWMIICSPSLICKYYLVRIKQTAITNAEL